MIHQSAIFGPFFAMIWLTFCVWICMYARRIPFIVQYSKKHKGLLDMNDLGNPSSRHYLPLVSPAHVRNASDNLKNLFEIPTLFYALIIFLYVTNQVDSIHVHVAWVFVVARYIHSIIHCTFNNVLRFYVYAFSTFCFWFMALRASISYYVTTTTTPPPWR
jgi:hypothetical protein